MISDQYENERRILIQRLNDRDTIEIARHHRLCEEPSMGRYPHSP